MKQIEHDALFDQLMHKKKQMKMMMALLVLAFATYLLFVRPLLRAYI